MIINSFPQFIAFVFVFVFAFVFAFIFLGVFASGTFYIQFITPLHSNSRIARGWIINSFPDLNVATNYATSPPPVSRTMGEVAQSYDVTSHRGLWLYLGNRKRFFRSAGAKILVSTRDFTHSFMKVTQHHSFTLFQPLS